MTQFVLKLAPTIMLSLSAGLHDLANRDISFLAKIKDSLKIHTVITLQFFWIAILQWWFYDNILGAIGMIPLAIMHHGMWRHVYIYDNIRWALVAISIVIMLVVW